MKVEYGKSKMEGVLSREGEKVRLSTLYLVVGITSEEEKKVLGEDIQAVDRERA